MNRKNGIDTVKHLKFAKVDYKICKNEKDLEFREIYRCNDLTPIFFNFKLANNNLWYSKTYKQCQTLLLNQKIPK